MLSAGSMFVTLLLLFLFSTGFADDNRAPADEVSNCNASVFKAGRLEISAGRYKQARLQFSKLQAPDCRWTAAAKLLAADCYYREGGSRNLANAELEYRSWWDAFPRDELAPLVMLKVADCHMRCFGVHVDHVLLADRALKKLSENYPQFKTDPRVQEYLMVIQEIRAEHELKVARFYFSIRESPVATELRCREIVDHYSESSKMDVALWYLAQALEMQSQAPDNPLPDSRQNNELGSGAVSLQAKIEANTQAATDEFGEAKEVYERLARDYPGSEYWGQALEKLRAFGIAAPAPNFVSDAHWRARTMKLLDLPADLYTYSARISHSGVLVDENDGVDIESVRRLTKRPAVADAAYNPFPDQKYYEDRLGSRQYSDRAALPGKRALLYGFNCFPGHGTTPYVIAILAKDALPDESDHIGLSARLRHGGRRDPVPKCSL